MLLVLALTVVAAGAFIGPTLASAGRAPAVRPDAWWPTYGGSYANTRHLDLNQIGPDNVDKLKLAWRFSTGVSGQFETSPIAVDGVLYVTTGSDNGVFAVDAQTGAQKWHYVPKVGQAPYIFAVNRGVAVDGGRVYFTTVDDQLIALDERTGRPAWTTRVGDPRSGLSETAAPLAWSGLVFVGSSGGEFGVRGSYSAYAQKDGRLVWRWFTVSRGWEGRFSPTVRGIPLHRNLSRERADAPRYSDAWKHGGGAIWMTPALDPATHMLYISTGNPAPAFNGSRRPGDNLYTDCIVALDARSGKLKWYYQETPHDVWDYDAASPPLLFDARDARGRRVPAVGQAGKTGWMYVVNRATGALIRVSTAFVPQPFIYHPLSAKGAPIEPGDGGGAVGSMAYDPVLRSAFVAGNVIAEIGQIADVPAWTLREDWKGGNMQEQSAPHESAVLASIDTDSGRLRWTAPLPNTVFGGPLSLNGLVFVGEEAGGTFRAYDARDGNLRWSVEPGNAIPEHAGFHDYFSRLAFYLSWLRHPHGWYAKAADIHAPAVAYQYKGREYILVSSSLYQRAGQLEGDTLFAFALP